jgi:hypothetical protein
MVDAKEGDMGSSSELNGSISAHYSTIGCCTVAACIAIFAAPARAEGEDKSALIRDALSAAPPMIAETATVMDWDGTVLKQGTGAYMCHPTPPDLRKKGGREPMCVDQVWRAWADAWMNKKPFKTDRVGVSYMLAGDTGASNIDPYAESMLSLRRLTISGSLKVPTLWCLRLIPHSSKAYPLTRTVEEPT